MKNIDEKIYSIFAGVNGAGKSTLYKVNFDCDIGVRINYDEILKGFGGDWENEYDQRKAFALGMNKLLNAIKENKNINHETVLTGDIYNFFDMILKKNYKIRLYYVGVENFNIAIERVEKRKHLGGHGVSRDDIIRRYYESLENLKIVLPLCEETFIYDNTNNLLKVAEYKNGVETKLYNYCSWYNKLFENND